jgi:hypothetical protein
VRVLPLSSLPDEALREERRRAIEAVLGPAVRVRL